MDKSRKIMQNLLSFTFSSSVVSATGSDLLAGGWAHKLCQNNDQQCLTTKS